MFKWEKFGMYFSQVTRNPEVAGLFGSSTVTLRNIVFSICIFHHPQVSVRAIKAAVWLQ